MAYHGHTYKPGIIFFLQDQHAYRSLEPGGGVLLVLAFDLVHFRRTLGGPLSFLRLAAHALALCVPDTPLRAQISRGKPVRARRF